MHGLVFHLDELVGGAAEHSITELAIEVDVKFAGEVGETSLKRVLGQKVIEKLVATVAFVLDGLHSFEVLGCTFIKFTSSEASSGTLLSHSWCIFIFLIAKSFETAWT